MADSRYAVDEARIYLCYESIWAKLTTLTKLDEKYGGFTTIEQGAVFTLLHEIGHVILHQLELVQNDDKEKTTKNWLMNLPCCACLI